jgi:hypothetical protein
VLTISRAFVAFLLAALAMGCGSSDGASATPFTTPQRNPTISYDTGIGWTIDVFADAHCIQARSQALATPCVSTAVAVNSSSLTRYAGSGTQLVMLVTSTSDHVSGDWTSARQQLQKPFVEVAPGVQVGVFPMDGDDEPKQVRVLNTDGTLRHTYPLQHL